MRPFQVLATAFEDGELPEFRSQDDLRDFISLSLRRSNKYVRFFGLEKGIGPTRIPGPRSTSPRTAR